MLGGLRGVLGGKGGWGVKNFFPHPNELLIWAYPENLVEIELVVEAPDCSGNLGSTNPTLKQGGFGEQYSPRLSNRGAHLRARLPLALP